MSQSQLVDERPDTPRAAYDLLPRPLTGTVAASLLVVAAAGWAYTIREADSMSGMITGLGQVGGGMRMSMSIPSFMVMWAAMMVAMMAPTLVPVALAHLAAQRRKDRGPAPTAAFVVGFLVVWSAVGLIAYVPYSVILEVPASAADSRWLPALAGAVLAAVGALQFTGWKMNCLRMCRTPRQSIAGMDPNGTVTSAWRAGLAHGWHCLGCCWALMVVLLVVGVMNVAWMAVIALIFVVDKHWAHAEGLTQAVGGLFVVLGLAVIVFPDLLPFISGVDIDGPIEMRGM